MYGAGTRLLLLGDVSLVTYGTNSNPSSPSQAVTLAELDARSAAAKAEIASRYEDFSKYRDEAIELLKAADERVQAVGAVRGGSWLALDPSPVTHHHLPPSRTLVPVSPLQPPLATLSPHGPYSWHLSCSS